MPEVISTAIQICYTKLKYNSWQDSISLYRHLLHRVFQFTAGRRSSVYFLKCPNGSSRGCHPCVDLNHQMYSLSSKITTVKTR